MEVTRQMDCLILLYQNKVKKSVEEKTGLKVSGVNVHIQGVKTEINEPQEIIVDGKNEEK